jgi:hypothetical protein
VQVLCSGLCLILLSFSSYLLESCHPDQYDKHFRAVPVEVVDYARDAEVPAAEEAVRDEVEAPALGSALARLLSVRTLPSARLRPPWRRTRKPSSQ